MNKLMRISTRLATAFFIILLAVGFTAIQTKAPQQEGTSSVSPLIQDPSSKNTFIIDTSTVPSKDGFIFLGYSEDSKATTPTYVYNSETNTFTPNKVVISAPTTGFTSVVTLYTVWQALRDERTLANITYMQEINSDICENSTLDKQYTLKDKRDNKSYTVARLKMNAAGTETTCWMTQNLALVLSSTKALTSDDTDLNSTASWTPMRDTATVLSESVLPSATSSKGTSTPYSYYDSSYGGYYNFNAAVASNVAGPTTKYAVSSDSICPKGWRLPITYNGSSTPVDELATLAYANGIVKDDKKNYVDTTSFAKLQQAPIKIALGGTIKKGEGTDVGAVGQYWSSNIVSGSYGYITKFASAAVTPNVSLNRYIGASVRCVLR